MLIKHSSAETHSHSARLHSASDMLLAALLTCLVLIGTSNQNTLPDGITCPKYDIKEAGTFHSPEFNIHDDGAITGFHCWYNIKAPNENQVIVLEFLAFDLHEPMYTEKVNYDTYEVGCTKEFVDVYRDAGKEDKERYCGTELFKRTITSTSNKMKFVFNKYYKASNGFRVNLKFVEKTKVVVNPCKEMYGTETSVAITAAPEKCKIFAKAPVGKTPKLKMTAVTPATSNDLCSDPKRQKNGCNRRVVGCCRADAVKKGYNGDKNLLEIRVAPTSTLKASVSFVDLPKTCGGSITPKAGGASIKLPKEIETPVHNELSCVWTITVPASARGLKIKYGAFDLAPKTNSACGNDQFSAVEFRESDIDKFLERRSRESNNPVCGSDLAGKTQEFTSGKTVYLFLSMDLNTDYTRKFKADLTLL